MIWAILFWLFGGAMAQNVDYSIDIENFRPSSDPFGYTLTDGASTLGNLNMGVGFWWSHSDDPLVLMHNGQRVLSPIDFKDGVIDQRNTVDLQVGIGITKYFSLSLDLPVVLWQAGFRPEILPLEEVDVESSGLSDLRIAPKVVFLRTGEDSPIGLALITRLMIPTAMNKTLMKICTTPMLHCLQNSCTPSLIKIMMSINPILIQSGRGAVPLGARTLSLHTAFQFINTRRILNLITYLEPLQHHT